MTEDEAAKVSFKDLYRTTDEEWAAEKRFWEATAKLERTFLRCLSVVVGPDEKRADEMIQALAHMDEEKPKA